MSNLSNGQEACLFGTYQLSGRGESEGSKQDGSLETHDCVGRDAIGMYGVEILLTCSEGGLFKLSKVFRG